MQENHQLVHLVQSSEKRRKKLITCHIELNMFKNNCVDMDRIFDADDDSAAVFDELETRKRNEREKAIYMIQSTV